MSDRSSNHPRTAATEDLPRSEEELSRQAAESARGGAIYMEMEDPQLAPDVWHPGEKQGLDSLDQKIASLENLRQGVDSPKL
jgi:hypothetical protein